MSIKFGIIRVLVDCLCAGVLFFGFIAGIHYGTQITGLYFWFMKMLLGFVGLAAVLFVIRWLRSSILFLVKNCGIYAQCRDDCHTVMGALTGITTQFKSTISIPVFNKIVREALGTVKESVLNRSADNPVVGVLEDLANTKIGKVSTAVAEKAFDYVDECILGYCYCHASKEKGIVRCSLEAFTLFVVNSVPIFGKVITVITIEGVLLAFYWVFFVLWAFRTFHFSVMNVMLCYVLGKVISFILVDAIFEPMLMYNIIDSFKKRAWDSQYESKIDELIGSIPALGKLAGYDKGKNTGEEAGTEAEAGETTAEAGAGAEPELESDEPELEPDEPEFREL